MKRRFLVAAFAIIGATTCFIGGCALSESNENGSARVLPAFIRESSGYQEQESFHKLLKIAELQSSYNANSLKFYSSKAYTGLAAELEYGFERLSVLPEGGGEYAAQIAAINSIWSRISILAGELNSCLTESKAEPEPAAAINGYSEEADKAGTAILEGKKEQTAFISGFLKFLKRNNYSFSFTYSAA